MEAAERKAVCLRNVLLEFFINVPRRAKTLTYAVHCPAAGKAREANHLKVEFCGELQLTSCSRTIHQFAEVWIRRITNCTRSAFTGKSYVARIRKLKRRRIRSIECFGPELHVPRLRVAEIEILEEG